ncbi:FG-GAP-like repeat-containing protein [Neolewinella agarilytica]|uniref:FG-GAP-like repeat-containing protein n=1 Tax=Neolewinella agarilytica TaxID=478744 RepID=UPI002353835C|nr:FG-GAP-like repeat-containing protein [Neolewinella agarilytica]
MSTQRLFFAVLLLLAAQLCAQPFTRVDLAAGLSHISDNNGVAIADFDGDGDEDIFFTGYHSFEAAADSTWNRLMSNNGDGTFTDVTIAAGFTDQFVNNDVIASLGEKMGASWGDYDNDGFPDLYLSNSRKDQLYHNNGDGTFTDVSIAAGLVGCNECYSGGATWFDHDRDGDLDLYVSVLNGPNLAYENLGEGTFSLFNNHPALFSAGITWTTTAIDIGKDGFLDLYLANDTEANQCLTNTSGLHYNESGLAYRMADEGAGMGIAVGDYNNDGLFDIYVTNIFSHHPNPLFKNTGRRRYVDVAENLAVDNTGWGWGVQFFDADQDGDEDLFAVNGVVSKQYIGGVEQQDEPHCFFQNTLIENREEGFVNRSADFGLDGMERARGMEVFDYDGDGDLDVIIANVASRPMLFRNDLVNDGNHNFFKVRLEGTESNRSAYGTEVRIKAGEQTLYRWYHGTSFFAQSLKAVHFGIGAATKIDELQITWLSGKVETYYDLDVNQTVNVIEGGELTDLHESDLVNDHPSTEVFPNPFQDKAYFSTRLQAGESIALDIFSITGQHVWQTEQIVPASGIAKFRWGGGNQPAGTYIYRLSSGRTISSGKLIKK